MENAEALLKQYYCENNFQIINFSNKTDRKRICYVFFPQMVYTRTGTMPRL